MEEGEVELVTGGEDHNEILANRGDAQPTRVMAATYGRIAEFDQETDDWKQYVERLDFYFVANDIKEDVKKRAIFLSACGSKVYGVLRDLCQPDSPAAFELKDLLSKLSDHYTPKPSVIVQRFKFHSKSRQTGQSVSSFVVELRRLSEFCEFGTVLDDMLRDRLVCGINDDCIQKRLLAETNLTLAKAVELATSMETASKNVTELQQGLVDPVHKMKIQPSGERPTAGGCYRCGGTTHNASDCRFMEAVCHTCHKRGHLARKCRMGRQDKQRDNKKIGDNRPRPTYFLEGDASVEENTYHLFNVKGNKVKPYTVKVDINGQEVDMEIDTGAGVTLVNEETFKMLGGRMQHTTVNLRTYTGDKVNVLGEIKAEVKYNGEHNQLPLLVVQGRAPNLLGRNWLQVINLDWRKVFKLETDHQRDLDTLLSKHKAAFETGLGTLAGATVKIYVEPEAKPKYFKARPLPYALREKVETELTRLETEGIIEPVDFSEWAAPIVPIVKQDKSLRICGDYKVTVNQVSKLDNYPIPKTEDLLAVLGGGDKFTKLDMSQAYQQLRLDENSKKYTTINTHRGLYQYTRLPYGVSSAPGIFQRTMDNLLQGIPQVVVRVDDILVTGNDNATHLQNLETVLERLENAGLRLRQDKCVFMAPEVVYLGYKIDRNGIHPVADKVLAIKNAPTPTNQTQLRAFLGMLNYYHKFLPNVSSVLEPLHVLLRKGTVWRWGTEQEQAFTKAKDCLQSEQLLVHFDDKKPLCLACDASPYGVGAVLAHQYPDGSERPIGFMSRSLTPAERGYSQLEKEALSIMFGLKKFHQYLYGHHFTILTDHKPLLGLLGENKGIPVMAAARIQRWALTLEAYDYTLAYKEGSKHANADGLSRLPLPDTLAETPQVGDVILLLEHMDSTPVDVAQIRTWTRQDPTLSRVHQWTLQGWPSWVKDPALQPFYRRKHELSVEGGCVLWGTRVIIPPQGRRRMMKELHEAHPGASRMKALARSFVWWPGMDADLEEAVRKCHTCQVNQATPAAAPLHPWEWPSQPWMRVHIDFCGPVMGKMFLIAIDAHSKWIEAHSMTSITSTATIEKLRSIFAEHGIPAVLVSDNGPSLVSTEFKQFLTKNGIKHVTSAPYHPASNGLAERAVRVFKEGVKKMGEGSVETKVSRFLLKYRTTPQTTTGETPAELLMNRRLRTHLDLVRPSLAERVQRNQSKQKQQHDLHARDRDKELTETVAVYVRGYQASGEKWIPGILLEKTGPVSWKVRTQNGQIVRRHNDQIRPRRDNHGPPPRDPEEVWGPSYNEVERPAEAPVEPQGAEPPQPALVQERRYPVRDRQAPSYLRDYVQAGEE